MDTQKALIEINEIDETSLEFIQTSEISGNLTIISAYENPASVHPRVVELNSLA